MKIQRNNKRQSGFSLIELLIVISIMLVIVAIAAPAVVSSIQASNESSAASTLKQIVNAEIGYRGLYNNYSPTAASLGGAMSATSCPSIPTATAGCFLSNGIALQLDAGVVSGYNFVFTSTNGNQGFSVSATPTSSYTGRKAYFVDNSGQISYSLGTTAMTAQGTALGQ